MGIGYNHGFQGFFIADWGKRGYDFGGKCEFGEFGGGGGVECFIFSE